LVSPQKKSSDMLNTSFSPWPSFTTEEANAVSQTILSNKVNYWTGQECRLFETEFAAWCGTSHAIALSNGTLALDLCWKALAIGPGDEVIVTPRTFLASASSVVNSGAVPVFADVDPNSGNITPETAARVITPRTKAILLVHLAGWPCDMVGFAALAASHNLLLVEDCAQAHGAAWNGVSVGTQSAMSAWSFCQDKIMTTGGEGGMVTTASRELWSKAWSYKDHGKSWEAVYERQHPPGYRWVHETIGTNWRMLEMQAAIGRIQLRRMTDWTVKRTANANAIMGAAQNFSVVRVPDIPPQARHAHYKTYLYVRPEALKSGWTRDRIVAEVVGKGVPCLHGSCSEVYLEKAFDHAPGRPTKRLPNARELGETSIMFMVHPTLTETEIHLTTTALRAVLSEAQR
jgi:dTDP-4-amino-4,6-dideoxygalactose transaminase